MANWIPINDLVTRDDMKTRGKIDSEVVNEYASLFEERGYYFDPIRAFKLDGQLVVVDGWHRLEASKQAGLEQIKVEVKDGYEWEDAVDSALAANSGHGKQDTKEDMETKYELGLSWGRFNPEETERISKKLGCSVRWARSLNKADRDKQTKERNKKIRELLDAGWSQRGIANELGVSKATVNRVNARRKSCILHNPQEPFEENRKTFNRPHATAYEVTQLKGLIKDIIRYLDAGARGLNNEEKAEALRGIEEAEARLEKIKSDLKSSTIDSEAGSPSD